MAGVIVKQGRGLMVPPGAAEPVWLDEAQIAGALADGFTPATDKQYHRNRLAKEYDRPVEAALMGGLRGLTFGASDVIGTKLGLMTPQHPQLLREHNPWAAGAGEAAGVAASFMIPGGAGARLATGAGRVGGLAGRATAKAAASLGATGRIAQAAPQVVARVAQSATEGAAIASAFAASDLAITEKPVSLEQGFNIMKRAATHGALLGGGLTAGGLMLAGGGKAIARVVGRRRMAALEKQRAGLEAELQTVTSSAEGAELSRLAGMRQMTMGKLEALRPLKSFDDELVGLQAGRATEKGALELELAVLKATGRAERGAVDDALKIAGRDVRDRASGLTGVVKEARGTAKSAVSHRTKLEQQLQAYMGQAPKSPSVWESGAALKGVKADRFRNVVSMTGQIDDAALAEGRAASAYADVRGQLGQAKGAARQFMDGTSEHHVAAARLAAIHRRSLGEMERKATDLAAAYEGSLGKLKLTKKQTKDAAESFHGELKKAVRQSKELQKGIDRKATPILKKLRALEDGPLESARGGMVGKMVSWFAARRMMYSAGAGAMGGIGGFGAAYLLGPPLMRAMLAGIKGTKAVVKGAAGKISGSGALPVIGTIARGQGAAYIGDAEAQDVLGFLGSIDPETWAGGMQEAAVKRGLDYDLSKEAIAEAVEQLSYLAEKAPKDELGRPDFARRDLTEFKRHYRAVATPAVFAADLAAGKLTEETVEVWKRLYPAALVEVQQLLAEAVDSAHARGEKIDDHMMRQIALIMGDPSMVPDRGGTIIRKLYQQASGQPDQQQQPKPSGSIDTKRIVERNRVKSDRLLDWRA